jgi:outer membrane protein assembly factor BamB
MVLGSPAMKAVRLWPLAAILVSAAAWLGRVWTGDAIRQDKVIGTYAASAVVLMLILLWLVLLSRMPWRVRLGGTAAFVAAAGLALASVRVRGVTGDIVPVLEWRWAARSRPSPVPVTPSASRSPDVARPASGPAAEVAHAPPSMPAAPVAASAAASTAASTAGDYPQFLGPDRNGVLPRIHLATDWTLRPPRRIWRQGIGAGWSGFAVAGGVAVTQEQQGEDELVVSYDLATGAERWRHANKARYDTVVAGEGPRATPTIAGGRVFTMGATGWLSALDLATGAPVWGRNVIEEHGGHNPQWGKSCSPLVVGPLVVVSAGGPAGHSLVAYDAETGRPAWQGGSDESGYSSPVMAELAGVRQILIFNSGTVAAHDPATGALLWEHAWPAEQPNVAQPLLLAGDRLLVSAGYGVGSKLFHVARADDGGLRATLVWETPRLKAKFTNLVVHDGYVYGLDDGVLVCLDPASGERRWRAGRYGHGQVILAGGLLLVQTEEGEVVLVRPSPEALIEVARFAALDGKTWNPPALAGARLVVRNDREAAAYDLPLEAP